MVWPTLGSRTAKEQNPNCGRYMYRNFLTTQSKEASMHSAAVSDARGERVSAILAAGGIVPGEL